MKSVEFGKKIVTAIILVLIITNVITMINMVVQELYYELATSIFFGLVGFALLGSILYYFYAGDKVSKWLLVVATLFSGITGFLVLILAVLTFNKDVITFYLINMLPIVIICIAIGITLIISRPVNNFLKFQRGEYKEESNDNECENKNCTEQTN